jgi:hypothetical protein
MENEDDDVRKRGYVLRRAILDYGMGIIIFGFGVFFLVARNWGSLSASRTICVICSLVFACYMADFASIAGPGKIISIDEGTFRRTLIMQGRGILIGLVASWLIAGCGGGATKGTQETPINGTINISVDESFRPVIDSEIKVFESSFPMRRSFLITRRKLNVCAI